MKKETLYKRICPKCKKEIFYTRLNKMQYAESIERLCKKCSQIKLDDSVNRICPLCGKDIMYKNKYMKSRAESFRTVCNSCHVKNMWKNDNFKQKMTTVLQSNDLKRQSTRANGGKYRDWHFRSRLELFYVKEILEKENKKWESAEKIKIPFIWKNKKRFYRPDLIVNDNEIIEIKMTSQINEEINQVKFQYATEWCKNNNFKFVIIDPSKNKNFYTADDIAKMIIEKIIVLDKVSESMANRIKKFS